MGWKASQPVTNREGILWLRQNHLNKHLTDEWNGLPESENEKPIFSKSNDEIMNVDWMILYIRAHAAGTVRKLTLTKRHWKMRSFCPGFMTHRFKPAGRILCTDMLREQKLNFISATYNFSVKTVMPHKENIAARWHRFKSSQHVPYCVPTVTVFRAPGVRGYSLIWVIWVCAAPKDMVFSHSGH